MDVVSSLRTLPSLCDTLQHLHRLANSPDFLYGITSYLLIIRKFVSSCSASLPFTHADERAPHRASAGRGTMREDGSHSSSAGGALSLSRSTSTRLLSSARTVGARATASGILSAKTSNASALPTAKRQLLPVNGNGKEGAQLAWKSQVQSHQPSKARQIAGGGRTSASQVVSSGRQQHTSLPSRVAGTAPERPASETATIEANSSMPLRRSITSPAVASGLRSPPPAAAATGRVQGEPVKRRYSVMEDCELEGGSHAKRPHLASQLATAYPGVGQVSDGIASEPTRRLSLKPRRSMLAQPPGSTSSFGLSKDSHLSKAPVEAAKSQTLAASNPFGHCPPVLAEGNSASLIPFARSPTKFGLTMPREFKFTAGSSAQLRGAGEQSVQNSADLPSSQTGEGRGPEFTGSLRRSHTLHTSLSRAGPSYAIQGQKQSGSVRALDLSAVLPEATQTHVEEGSGARGYLSPSRQHRLQEQPTLRRSITPIQRSDMLRSDLMVRTLESPTKSADPGIALTSSAAYPAASVFLSRSAAARRAVSMEDGEGQSVFSETGQRLLLPVTIASDTAAFTSGDSALPSAAQLLPSPLKRSRSPDLERPTADHEDSAMGGSCRNNKLSMTKSASVSALSSSSSGRTRFSQRRASRLASESISATMRPKGGSEDAETEANDRPASRHVSSKLSVGQTLVGPGAARSASSTAVASREGQPILMRTSPSSCTFPDHSTDIEHTRSATSLDMDTSVMSMSGHESLSNLNALLCKMSLPRRRSSTGISSSSRLPSSKPASGLNLLDQHAEREEHISGEGSQYLKESGRRAPLVPRYASATASSDAKSGNQAPSSSSKGDPRQVPAISALRRSSTGLPGPRRASLLPIASISQAARQVLGEASDPSRLGPLGSFVSDPAACEAAAEPRLESLAGTEGTVHGERKEKHSTALGGVVAFVDVKTSAGDEAGGLFVDMLRSLGAKVGCSGYTGPALHPLVDAKSASSSDRSWHGRRRQ